MGVRVYETLRHPLRQLRNAGTNAEAQCAVLRGRHPAERARRRSRVTPSSRREFLVAGTAAAAAAALIAAPGDALADEWQPSPRYPDPLIKVIDPSFGKYRLGLAKVEKIASGMRWAEGPVWFGDGRFLLWSDIPNNRIMKWEEETG